MSLTTTTMMPLIAIIVSKIKRMMQKKIDGYEDNYMSPIMSDTSFLTPPHEFPPFCNTLPLN